MISNFGLQQLLLHVSSDGVHFTPFDGGAGILADGGSRTLLTPHIRVTSPTSFDAFFSLGTGSGAAESTHRWSFALQPQN
jgi:hypothetical protein